MPSILETSIRTQIKANEAKSRQLRTQIQTLRSQGPATGPERCALHEQKKALGTETRAHLLALAYLRGNGVWTQEPRNRGRLGFLAIGRILQGTNNPNPKDQSFDQPSITAWASETLEDAVRPFWEKTKDKPDHWKLAKEEAGKAFYKAYCQMDRDARFTPDQLHMDRQRIVQSPSGKYRLVITPGRSWASLGEVYSNAVPDARIAVVKRNYSSFPHLFIEGHDGHDYLVCGEDYQGQTVIQLDTGKRRNHLPPEAKKGWGFCWSGMVYDPATKLLTVEGCHWACPYEFRFYDFAQPMRGWPELDCDECIDNDRRPPVVHPDGTVETFQTAPEPDEWDEDTDPPLPVAATTTWRREGNKLVKVQEDVTVEEAARRQARQEANARYEAWEADFKAKDPLYLRYKERVADPRLKPEKHESRGVTHSTWCPDFQEKETRWCRRIAVAQKNKEGVYTQPHTIEVEWAVKTGPVKLDVHVEGKAAQPLFFPHTVEGMDAAFDHALALLAPEPARLAETEP